MVIVWRLRGNGILSEQLCAGLCDNVHSPQHTYMSSSYRSNRLALSHWDPHAMRRGGCLELYYCNMVEWFCGIQAWSLTTKWFPSVLWHCWFGHLACKNRPRNDLFCVEWDIKPYTLTYPTHLVTCWALLTDDLRWPGFKSRSGDEFSVGWTNGRYAMRLISRTGTEGLPVFSLNCDRCRL